MYNSGANLPNQGQQIPMQNQGPPMQMHGQGQMLQGQSMPIQGQPMAIPLQQNLSPMMVPMSAQQPQTHGQSPAMAMTQQPLTSNNTPMMTLNNAQQQQLHQPQQNMQAAGQMSQYSPYAASVMSQNSNAPASQDYPSVSSVQSQQPVQSQSSQQQPAGGQLPSSSKPDVPSGTTPMPFLTMETDPYAALQRMIQVDMRHDMQNWAAAANVLALKKFHITLFDTVDAAGGVSGDTSLKSVPQPPSNINNPLSVNPQSVAPPPSMNPMSVNTPSSAADGETVAAGGASNGLNGTASAMPLNSEEHYVNCLNKLLNTMDNIERVATTINEAIHAILRQESTCLVSAPIEYATVGVPQLQQKYVDEKRQQMAAIAKVCAEVREMRKEIISPSLTQAAPKDDAPTDAKNPQ